MIVLKWHRTIQNSRQPPSIVQQLRYWFIITEPTDVCLFIYSFMPFYKILLYFHERKKGTGRRKKSCNTCPYLCTV